MAEVRKVKPGRGGHIAAAVEKAMGESVRPIAPGGSPDPSKKPAPQKSGPTLTATSFVMSDPFLFTQPRTSDEPEDPRP